MRPKIEKLLKELSEVSENMKKSIPFHERKNEEVDIQTKNHTMVDL